MERVPPPSHEYVVGLNVDRTLSLSTLYHHHNHNAVGCHDLSLPRSIFFVCRDCARSEVEDEQHHCMHPLVLMIRIPTASRGFSH